MKNFDSLDDFDRFFRDQKKVVRAAQREAIKESAIDLRDNARARLGTYQDAVGGFKGWKELSDVTKAHRKKAGFTENDPLKASGKLQKSIQYKANSTEAVVGSNSPYAAAQEKGEDKKKLPPRPYLGPAGFTLSHSIVDRVGLAVAKALAGQYEIKKKTSKSS